MCVASEKWGVSHARKVGIDFSCGEYVVFADGDN